MKVTYISVLLALSYALSTNGQNRVAMPPSATPASLAKYIDNPVSYYTGIPDIKVPIWDIKLKGYNLPIQLSYHAGGVKVEEEASIVGLNWSLMAGGVITRAIKDVPDDYNKDGKISWKQDRPFNSDNSAEHPRLGRFWSGKYEVLRDFNFASTDNDYIWPILDKMKANFLQSQFSMEGNNDLEPDIFYFNFGNKSGKFVFDVEGNTQRVALFPYQDLQITHTFDADGKINSFTVVDNDGTTYVFSTIEAMERRSGSVFNAFWNYSPDAPDRGEASGGITYTKYNSSWFLTSIQTIYNERISFSYDDEELFQWDRPMVGRVAAMPSSGMPYEGVFLNTFGINVSAAKKRISKIETSNEIINFFAQRQRDDLEKISYAISEIQVVNKASGNPIKSFQLSHSYFVSPATEPITLSAPTIPPVAASETYIATCYKRLRLDKITEKGENFVTNPPYIFEYDLSTPLPHRFSFQQDIWGYFNGAVANKGMIPTIYQYPSLNGSDRFRVYKPCYPLPNEKVFLQSDRLPSATKMTAGMLIGITLPTGGRIGYEYEPNTFRYENCKYTGGGVRIKNIKSYTKADDAIPALTKNYIYENPDGSTNGRVISLPIFSEQNLAQYKFFSFSSAMLGTTSGSMVGYLKVVERFSNNNGSITYEYSMPALHGETTDTEYLLYNISRVKWIDNVTPGSWGDHPTYYQEFLQLKNAYHLLPNTPPFPPNPDYDWNRGRLLKQTTADASGNPKEEIINTYAIYDGSSLKNKKSIYGLAYSVIGYSENSHMSSLIYSKYEYLTNRANVLTSTTKKEYNTNGIVSNIENYTYNGTGHMNITEKTTFTSTGDKLVTKFRYPLDYPADNPLPFSLLTMRNKNITSTPLEVMRFVERNNQRSLLSAQLTQYDLYNNKYILPQKQYVLEVPAPITNFRESYTQYEEYGRDPRYKEVMSFDNYDTLANPVQLTLRQQTTSYLWGNNNIFPIAEAKNAVANDIAYSSFESNATGNWTIRGGIIQEGAAVTGTKYLSFGQTRGSITKDNLDPARKYRVSIWYKSAMGTVPGNGFNLISGPNANGWSLYEKNFTGQSSFAFDFLRCELDEIRLQPILSEMTTNVYTPLIGLQSITDNKGQIAYYEYDNFQRLQSIKDQNGKIKKLVKYNYGTQSVDGTDIFATSFEEETMFGIINGIARTGTKSFDSASEELPPTAMYFEKLLTGLYPGKYVLSWWVRLDNQWVNHETTVTLSNPGSTNSYRITISGLIDDVRFYYKGAN